MRHASLNWDDEGGEQELGRPKLSNPYQTEKGEPLCSSSP